MAKEKQSTEQAPADRPPPKFDGKFVTEKSHGTIAIARCSTWDEEGKTWRYGLHYLSGGACYTKPEADLRLAVGDAERFTIAMHRRKTELAQAEARVEVLKREIAAMETTMRIIGEEPDTAPA